MSLRSTLPALALVRPVAAAAAKQHVKFRAEASQESGTFELDVYDIVDPIGENMWWGTTFVSAKDVRAKLKAAGDVAKIVVRINSVGGDVFDGTAIYNLLKDHPARVEVHVDGICASIASIIAMAGDDITMGQGTWMMIHEPYSQMMLDARSDDLRKAADTLDKMRDGLCAVYAERTGIDEKECLALMQEETWMTADEALEKGFCTAINSVPLNTTADADASEVDSEKVEAMVAEMTRNYSRIPAGALQAMNIATHSYAIAASVAAAAARPRAEEDADDKKKMKSLEEDKQALQDEVTQLKKDLKKAEEEADKAKKAKAEEDEKLKAEAAKKDEFPEKKEEEEESTGGDDKAKNEAQALAMLALDVRALTGTASIVDARKALASLVAKSDSNEQVEAEMVEMAKERYEARVSDCIAKGMVRPSRKEYMLNGLDKVKNMAEFRSVSARLDSWLSASGGEVVGPALNQEHRMPDVNKLADSSGKGIITAQDRAVAKVTGATEEQLQEAANLRAARFGNPSAA